MAKEVYIVHCVDTEGPLYEPLDANFERVEQIYDIKIEHTKENLIKLQNKEIDLEGYEEAISNMLSPQLINTNETWDQIDKMLSYILSNEFRNKFLDNNGNGWIYNWFCMDHVGFNGYNPRRRDAGYHNIYDHYKNILKEDKAGDLIQWHYHPLPFNGDYNGLGVSYVASSNVFEILSRKIIDRSFFPAAYRPGFHTERPDSNWFLEQWIPFDYANQSVKGKDTDQPDLSNGRYGDWRRATTEWKVYHPSHDDYQIEGNCRRWIARCLNMQTRLREINIDDFREGFNRANEGKPTIISFTDHDFRDMSFEIDKMRDMIQKVSKEYPDVKFFYSDAITAMRRTLDLVPKKSEINVQFYKNIKRNSGILEVNCKNDIFGPQPYLAIKTITGNYYWDNFDFQNTNNWSYTFDTNSMTLNMIEKIGVAANSPEGVTEVIVYDVINDVYDKKVYNE